MWVVICHFQAYTVLILLTNRCEREEECESVWWDFERIPIFENKKKICLMSY